MSEPSDAVVLDCPFCGASAEHGRWITGCTKCAAGIDHTWSTTASSPAERLAAWNRRVVVGGKPEIPGT